MVALATAVMLTISAPASAQLPFTATAAGCQVMCAGTTGVMATCTGTVTPTFANCAGGATLCTVPAQTTYTSIAPSNLSPGNLSIGAQVPNATAGTAMLVWNYATDGMNPSWGVRFRFNCDGNGGMCNGSGTSTRSAACRFNSPPLPVELMEFSVDEEKSANEE